MKNPNSQRFALSLLALTVATFGATLATAANAQPYRHGPYAPGPAYGNVRDARPDGSYVNARGDLVYPNPIRPVGQRVDNASYMFDVLDDNRNGAITRTEFFRQYGSSRRIGNLFYRLDTNRSGVLGRTEIYQGLSLLPRTA